MATIVTRNNCSAGLFQVIDDFKRIDFVAQNGSVWRLVSDGVMGGLSKGSMIRDKIKGRNALRMRGKVRLENNGGFIQIALNLSPDGSPIDASSFTGIEIDVIGDDESYNLHLRTSDLSRPWQSYRKRHVKCICPLLIFSAIVSSFVVLWGFSYDADWTNSETAILA